MLDLSELISFFVEEHFFYVHYIFGVSFKDKMQLTMYYHCLTQQ